MNLSSKKITIITIILFTLSIVGGLAFAYFGGFLSLQAEPDIIPKKIKVTNVSDAKFTISWVTDGQTQGAVVYGQNGDLKSIQIDDRDQLTGENNSYFTHHITVSSLNPATTYQFKIHSGTKSKVFDSSGQPFSVTTAPALTAQPSSDLINGTVVDASGSPAAGSIIYVSLPQMSPLSTQVKKDGSWLLNLATAYSEDLTEYAQYDQELEIIDILVQGETSVGSAITTTANKSPVPNITLGQTFDFTDTASADASKEEAEETATDDLAVDADSQLPEIFLQDAVFDMSDDTTADLDIDANVATNTATETVIITNPAQENEELNSSTPEFLGTGPEDTLLTIRIISLATVRGSTFIDSDGYWQYTPTAALSDGSYTLEVDFTNADGELETIARKFVIAVASGSGGNVNTAANPAFESTPSATPKATPVPTATPRAAIPATSSGIPVSGSATPTLLVLIMGLVLLGGGLYARKANLAN